MSLVIPTTKRIKVCRFFFKGEGERPPQSTSICASFWCGVMGAAVGHDIGRSSTQGSEVSFSPRRVLGWAFSLSLFQSLPLWLCMTAGQQEPACLTAFNLLGIGWGDGHLPSGLPRDRLRPSRCPGLCPSAHRTAGRLAAGRGPPLRAASGGGGTRRAFRTEFRSRNVWWALKFSCKYGADHCGKICFQARTFFDEGWKQADYCPSQ